ncbi:MAG: ribose 5-phosphate isomerase B [Bacteroidetes bacterium]|nr:MAG: ribose 5-phosphate isomerase B [Bacteroidota bacterium]
MVKETIGLASDHAGYELKVHLKVFLEGRGYGVLDYGTDSTESCDYPVYAGALARGIQQGDVQLGIGICGSGNGISMALNRHKGVRAALSWTSELATLGRQHNDANVLSLPARFVTEAEAENIVDAFLGASFEGGRHQRRVDLMENPS